MPDLWHKNTRRDRREPEISHSSQIKPKLPLSFVVSGDYLLTFPVLRLSVCQVSQPQRGTVEVCAGGMAVEPGGGFLLSLPLLHRCLLAYMSCHMFPARPPPEGAKSVFAHNLHSLTKPLLPLTGTHGVAFMKHSRSITQPFSLFFSSTPP